MKVRHIVMWDVAGTRGSPEHAANLAALKQAFEPLAASGVIPGLLKLEIGIDYSAVDYACDVVLLSEFDSAEALAVYQTHPAHAAAKQQIGDIRIARHQVDYYFN
ncbi:Stress responsive A/B Barrel Domain-containing protein [Herbaspirillum sp. CF444]|uniref:Dabb family protein n=1 Tax=Herbaspirillum sp. CF444 TaxID=1144319 RepID=UPI0002724B59|nr:Dabb family protein [Herbaspirillum sp. CF444]EJL94246.1 Stress responsive A/B Barrel Domain-containing protein [Herbaspirillum sp. CF444]